MWEPIHSIIYLRQRIVDDEFVLKILVWLGDSLVQCWILRFLSSGFVRLILVVIPCFGFGIIGLRSVCIALKMVEMDRRCGWWRGQ